MRNKPWCRVVGVLFLLLVSQVAHAYPTERTTPSTEVYTGSYKCTDCHVGDTGCTSCGTFFPCWNLVGYQYWLSGKDALGSQDTDGDGLSNAAEMVSADSSAGFPRGAQVTGGETASATSCNMETCAINGSVTCNNNVRCNSTRHSFVVSAGTNHNSAASPIGTTLYYYTFGFSCDPGTSGTTSGTSLNYSCANINECSPNPCGVGTCTQRSLSGWTSPGYDCACPSGWVTNGSTCVVSNACIANTDDCVAAATCNNLGGGAFSCTCGAGYTGNGRASGTGCSDLNTCGGNPCDNSGDLSATCTDEPPPSTTYTCNCTSPGFVKSATHGGVCVGACGNGPDPCNGGTGGSCSGSSTWTCSCPSGYASTGGPNPTCAAYNACTTTANAACVITAPGGQNKCVDEAPPSATYHCTCGASGYTGTNTTSCTDLNSCIGNPCDDSGDSGATCTDQPPGAASPYTCACSAGFNSNGTSCVSNCKITPPVSNPCGSGGQCVPSGSTWTCTCNAGYVSSGGAQPSCVNLDACNATANAACQTGSGNACVDEAPPSTSYRCTCGVAYTGTNTTSCVDKNECGGNPCDDNGNTSATCTDAVAPATGYACNCSVGFMADATSCTSACSDASNPCGVGGACTMVGTGGWTCACTSGYVTSSTNAGALPSCINFNACDATAIANCTSALGNGCTDDLPPSTGYQCNCGNAAYVRGTGTNGKPACVDRNECATNHCSDLGDTTAACTDKAAPATGYECSCSSSRWLAAVSNDGFLTCIDADECSAPENPCGHGTCTNIPDGGGYACTCDDGYVLQNATQAPSCYHPGSCSEAAQSACAATSPGNACLDLPPPRVGFECDCQHPAYVLSSDRRSCVERNECETNHCSEEGDSRAECVDRRAPATGYDCVCGRGWQANGTSCVDVNECSGGVNPCGAGTCTNTKGSYQCTCPSGAKLEDGTCKAGSSGYVSFTVIPGSGCVVTGTQSTPEIVSFAVLLFAALGIARRRRVQA